MSTFRYLTVEQVIRIHDSILPCPVINLSGLESAVSKPQASYGQFELYPTLLDKAAALLLGLARNHGFADANKRTAIHCCHLFLVANDVVLRPDLDDELIASFTERVAAGQYQHDAVVRWLSSYYGINQ